MLSKRVNWVRFAHSYLQITPNKDQTLWLSQPFVNNYLTKVIKRGYHSFATNNNQQYCVLFKHYQCLNLSSVNAKLTAYNRLPVCLTSVFHNSNTLIQARNKPSLLRFAPKGATAIINHLTGLMFNRNKTQNFIG